MSDVTSTGISYYVMEAIMQAWEHMHTFISNFQSENSGHLKLGLTLKFSQMLQVHRPFHCTDISIQLQTNLNIDITNNCMLMYYIFIDLFDPAGYYSPKKPLTKTLNKQ